MAFAPRHLGHLGDAMGGAFRGTAFATPRLMYHIVSRALPGTLLFNNHTEARALWVRVVKATPGLVALCLMPNHLHLQHPRPVRQELGKALSAYTRWRNRHRAESGPGVCRMPAPQALVDAKKRRRSERYIALNPCRARLVADPLAWPWSTHRDAVGLTLDVARPRVANPAAYHKYISSDPSVNINGTQLPMGQWGALAPGQVLHAASALLRVPVGAVHQRGPLRTLYLHAARNLTTASSAQIGALCSVTTRTVQRSPAGPSPALNMLQRVVGDARFESLLDVDLRRDACWRRYRGI